MKRRKCDAVALIGPEELLAEAVPGWVSTAVTSIHSMSNGEEAKLEIDAVVWDPGCPLTRNVPPSSGRADSGAECRFSSCALATRTKESPVGQVLR